MLTMNNGDKTERSGSARCAGEWSKRAVFFFVYEKGGSTSIGRTNVAVFNFQIVSM